MTTPSDQLLEILEAKDPALAAHLRVGMELMARPGGIHLKMAAHALREFGVLIPTALGIDRRRKGDGQRDLRALAPRWRALPTETQSGPLYESIYPGSVYSGSSSLDETSIPTDLFLDTRRAYDVLGNEDDFAEVMAAMVRILDPLGDPTFHAKIGPEVRHWHGLHKWFVEQCHAPSLDTLEEKRTVFLEKWQLYEASLRAMFGRAIDTIPELLGLAARSPAELGVLHRALALLKKAEPHRRFFLELDNSEWLAPLEAEHLFDNPYPPLQTGNLISFPQWPQSRFLIKVAGRAGPEVASVIQRIGPATENATVQADFVEAALEMPLADAASLVGVFCGWLSGPISMRVPLLLGKLGARLGKGGESGAALELLGAMLRFDPPQGDRGYFRSVVPRIERYVYEMTLKEIEQPLVVAAGHELLDLLCSRLRGAIRVENGSDADDHSWVWMTSLDSGGELSEGVKEAIAAAVVRVASTVTGRGPADCDRAVTRLRKEPFLIFRRVELQALAVRAATMDPARERLLDYEMFRDDKVGSEYGRLLAASWNQLKLEDQVQILGWIRKGPDQQWLIEAETERHGRAPEEDLLRRHRESWQLARLQPVADVLTGEGRQMLKELTGRGVEPAPPPFTRGVAWVGPTSPLDSEELESKSPDEILAFLREWAPSPDPMSPSREGLARILTEVVAGDARPWSVVAREFQTGIDPTYVRSLLDGLSRSAATDGALEWEPVLALCTWVVAQPRAFGGGRERDEDPDWSWTRRTIATLLQRGLQRGLGLSFEHRRLVWAIIEVLSADPDPAVDGDAEAGRDAESITLNSVRGVALHAAVEYALWCARNLTAQGRTPRTWFDEIPEARAHFEAKLDQRQEPSAAVPSVLAHYLPNLLFLDRGWLEQQLPRLFGGLGAAWQVHLLYVQLHGAVVPLLAPYYLRAAEEAGTTRPHEEKSELKRKLPEHLLLLHAHLGDKMPQLEEILAAFFEHAPARQLAHLIGFAGWHAHEAKDLAPEARDRIMELVERRVSVASRATAEGAREELSEWASLCRAEVFPNEWLLRIARMAVPACPPAHSDMWVGERMLKIADTDLEGALDILQMVSTRDLGPLGIHTWNEPAETILSRSIAADGELKERAIGTINNFTERGYGQFERFLPTK